MDTEPAKEPIPNNQGIENLRERVEGDDAGKNGRDRYAMSDAQVNKLLEIIDILTKERGSPPTNMQMRQYMIKNEVAEFASQSSPLQKVSYDHPFIKHALMWTDKVYVTKDTSFFSTERWNDDFMTFTEMFQKRWAKPYGYILDEQMRVRPGPDSVTVDFGELRDTLLSSDESLLETKAWMFSDKKHVKFLQNGTEAKQGRTVSNTGHVVSYISYPRCGNSFLRKYLQDITGIATGSDMALEFCVDLQMGDFCGEEITDDSVWVRKTHDPKWNLNNKTNICNLGIVCIRNPFDTIASIMNFLPSLNQGGTINEDFQKDIPEIWDKLLKETTQAFKINNEKVMAGIAPHVPLYFIRYEDLRMNPQKILEEVFCFMFGVQSVEGLNIQRRITEIVGAGHQATQVYDSKISAEEETKQKPIYFNRNISSFNEAQQKYVCDELRDFMEQYDYCSKGVNPYVIDQAWLEQQQDIFNFAKYEDLDDKVVKESNFKELNKKGIAWSNQLRADNKSKDTIYVVNGDRENQLRLPNYPDFMQLSMKEKEHKKKEA